jgi:ABC-type transporter Mla MlaB component
MLRITAEDAEPDGDRTLKLAGHLAGAWVGELRREADTCLAEAREVTLDLSEVDYVDARGADLLRHLVGRRVKVRGCSSFVAELLEGGKR